MLNFSFSLRFIHSLLQVSPPLDMDVWKAGSQWRANSSAKSLLSHKYGHWPQHEKSVIDAYHRCDKDMMIIRLLP